MANDKDIMILPPDDIRALAYQRFDAYPVKYLAPDGSVWSSLPVSIEELPLPSGAATSDKQLPNNHNVTVSNMIAAVETGLAKASNQTDGTQVSRITSKTGDTTYQNPRIDAGTHTLQTIDYAHHEIHDGSTFFVKDYMDLTNGQIFNFLVVTPDTAKWAHILVSFAFELEAHVDVYEGATASNNGTPVTVFNRDRNSLTASTTLLFHTPTVAGGAEGTKIAGYKAGSARSIGGEARSEAELILKQNTKYLIRVTNDTSNNNWFGYLADWYEHTNKTA